MPESYIERELKFDVEAGFAVPDVASLLPEGGRTEHDRAHLRSDYYDTGDRALLRAQMTLRRRTGTTDTGWQLKVPWEGFREEIRVDSTEEGVPEELRALLVGIRRGQELAPIASVTTDRSITRLVDAAGATLAEIDDDTVQASAVGESATVSSWREVEVELGVEDVKLLQAMSKRLRRAGAQSSKSASKLARALPAPTKAAKAGRRTAGDVIGVYVAEQQEAILAGDLALRRGDDAVIHKTRVATRRLRSTLRVFGPMFDVERAAALDGELRWFAALLGDVRDRQVLRLRLDAMLDELDESLLLGPVRARVDAELHHEQSEAWRVLQRELAEPRYLALLADVDLWVRQPPLTAKAQSKPDLVGSLAARAERKVAKRLATANASGDLHLLHGARKAAKRARYAAEAATSVLGAKAAARQAKRYEKLQDLLGEHQDSLVSADLLRRLGAKAGTIEGENGFAFGILHEREERAAAEARRNAQRAARKYR